jgi:hypothetical protein
MTTLDTLALPTTFKKYRTPLCLGPMLRDPHQRINTTSFELSYRRTSSRCGHWDICSYYALQSHVVTSLEVSIFMTSVTPLACSGCDVWSRSLWAALARCRGQRYQ